MKKMKEKIKTVPLFLEIKEEREIIKSDFDSSDWSGSTETIVTYKIDDAFFDRNLISSFFPPEKIQVPEDFKIQEILYLTVVSYTEGDTFSTTRGEYILGDVFLTLEDAKNWNPNTMTYRPWDDYFSQNSCNVDIWILDMKRGRCKLFCSKD